MNNEINGILIIDKQFGKTSRDVVNDLIHILHTKKIGHTGTLDPIATGVLVVCIGKCTKLCELLTSEYKEYIATIKLGVKTDTLDITGKIIEEQDYKVNESQIKKVLNSFLGHSIQTTPLYSAVKIKGKKLYEYARAGISVELPQREIDIKEIELLEYKDDMIKFRTVVSKGTYIRALIDDICIKLGTVGTMSDLRRTKQGLFTIDEAYTLQDIESGQYKCKTIEDVLKDMDNIELDDELYNRVKNGALINKTFASELVCLTYEGKIIAIYKEYEKDKKMAKPYKMFI